MEIIKIQISKNMNLNNQYKVIDKTFAIKNPPISFNNLSELTSYLKSTYKNNKISCDYESVWVTERNFIENELENILHKDKDSNNFN